MIFKSITIWEKWKKHIREIMWRARKNVWGALIIEFKISSCLPGDLKNIYRPFIMSAYLRMCKVAW